MNEHKTAMARSKLSTPARYLLRAGRVLAPGLDYGCGRGLDARVLCMDAFDPHWAPARPTQKYRTILCTYVLNVVDQATRKLILDDIYDLLQPGGRAYLTVRRDFLHDYVARSGVHQSLVRLALPVVEETSAYCIYEMRRES